MTTEEIVNSLRKNKMLSSVIPTWAYATIPYPFVRNGLKCLGFYFYQLKKDGENRRIMAPIFQIVVTYPSAKIVSITTSPLFLLHSMNPNSELGFYPSKGLAGRSLKDADAAYAAYYTACDNYFLSGKKEDWLRNLQVVKEDGMEPYYALFTMKSVDDPVMPVAVTERIVERSSQSVGNTPKFSPCALRVTRKTREFLSDKAFGRQLKELAILSRNFERVDYRVAVIGEFSRGKSTFLNGLIGRELLPIGDLPTTAVLTQIRKGNPEGLSFIGKDKSVSQGELSTESLEKYLADDAGHDPDGVLDLQVELPWLSVDNVVFYDTPGTGDLVGKRASIVLNAINSCDFTIMAISARAACSMTEMQFLRDNVMLKKIPQIAVAITKLDTIPEGERSKVVSFIREKIAAVAPSVRYFLMNDLAGVDRSQFDAIGVGEIRESIVSAFSSEKEIALARERQYLQRILLLLEETRREIDVIAAAETMTEQEKRDAIRELEMAKSDIDIVRLDLATKCSAAKLEAQKQVVDVVNEAESALMKKMTYSLQHSNDIRQWLELDFPHISDECFRATGMKLDTWMGRRIVNDKSAFAEAVRKRLAVQNLNISLPSFSVLPNEFRVNADMKNLDKWRTGARLATVGAMVLLSGLGPGVIIASGIGGILTDRFFKANIEKQRTDALAAISSKVQSVYSDLKDRAVDYLEGCYGKLAKVLNDETKYAVDNAIAKIKTAEGLADKMARPSVEKTEKLNALLSEVDACVRQNFVKES